MFSALYIVKHDEYPDVKLATTNVWSNFVNNTLKCLKNVYKVLVDMYINLFISGNDYHTEIAQASMVSFSGKYGDVFMTEVMEHLKLRMVENDPKVNQGICTSKPLPLRKKQS